MLTDFHRGCSLLGSARSFPLRCRSDVICSVRSSAQTAVSRLLLPSVSQSRFSPASDRTGCFSAFSGGFLNASLLRFSVSQGSPFRFLLLLAFSSSNFLSLGGWGPLVALEVLLDEFWLLDRARVSPASQGEEGAPLFLSFERVVLFVPPSPSRCALKRGAALAGRSVSAGPGLLQQRLDFDRSSSFASFPPFPAFPASAARSPRALASPPSLAVPSLPSPSKSPPSDGLLACP